MKRRSRSPWILALWILGAGVGCTRAGADDQALVEAAISAAPKARTEALTRLSEGGHAQAVPALVERLGDPDPATVARAVEALVAVGDPAAVPALIELSRRAEPTSRPAVVRAIGALGGRDAEAYLFTLETGSASGVVRAAAAKARADLKARRAAQAQRGPAG